MGKSVTLILRDNQLPNISTDIIGVDAGAAYAIRHHLPMICACGDFDSIDQETLDKVKCVTEVFQYPVHKDQPDSQLAIEKALELGYEEIFVYGALGGRYDHHHANIVLAYLHPEVTILDHDHWIKSFKKGQYQIKKESHEKLSVFTLESCVISLSEVEYPLDHYELKMSSILGLSNTFTTQVASLTVHQGVVLVICGKA
jgi:thiamine pyrophosphokinase